MVFGTVNINKTNKEAQTALQKLMDKYAPHLHSGVDYNPIRPKDLKRTAVYKINIEQWSAKQQSDSEDNPGAFHFPHQP